MPFPSTVTFIYCSCSAFRTQGSWCLGVNWNADVSQVYPPISAHSSTLAALWIMLKKKFCLHFCTWWHRDRKIIYIFYSKFLKREEKAVAIHASICVCVCILKNIGKPNLASFKLTWLVWPHVRVVQLGLLACVVCVLKPRAAGEESRRGKLPVLSPRSASPRVSAWSPFSSFFPAEGMCSELSSIWGQVGMQQRMGPSRASSSWRGALQTAQHHVWNMDLHGGGLVCGRAAGRLRPGSAASWGLQLLGYWELLPPHYSWMWPFVRLAFIRWARNLSVLLQSK